MCTAGATHSRRLPVFLPATAANVHRSIPAKPCHAINEQGADLIKISALFTASSSTHNTHQVGRYGMAHH
jgi:hypothetical protein